MNGVLRLGAAGFTITGALLGGLVGAAFGVWGVKRRQKRQAVAEAPGDTWSPAPTPLGA